MEILAFINGGIVMACLAVSLLFYGYWKRTDDLFFVYFSIAFLGLAIERVISFTHASAGEFHYQVYLIRLVAYGLLAIGILRKNRA